MEKRKAFKVMVQNKGGGYSPQLVFEEDISVCREWSDHSEKDLSVFVTTNGHNVVFKCPIEKVEKYFEITELN